MILYNAIETPDGTILESTHLSDLVRSFFEKDLKYRERHRIIIFDK